MTKFSQILLSGFSGVLLSCTLLTSSAHAQQELSQPDATQLYVVSGLQALVQQIPTSTASSFESTLTTDTLPEQFSHLPSDQIKTAIRNAFKADTFNTYMVREFDSAMSEQSIEHMLTWYSSPLGGRVKNAESDNSMLTQQSRFLTYQEQLLVTGVETERELLIQALDDAMKTTEAAVDTMSSVQVAFTMSMSRFLPEEQRMTSNELKLMASENHSQLMAQYRSQSREVLLFTYQNLSNDELSQFSNELTTDAGQEFVAAVNNGIKKGLFAASLDLGDELGSLLTADTRGPGI